MSQINNGLPLSQTKEFFLFLDLSFHTPYLLMMIPLPSDCEHIKCCISQNVTFHEGFLICGWNSIQLIKYPSNKAKFKCSDNILPTWKFSFEKISKKLGNLRILKHPSWALSINMDWRLSHHGKVISSFIKCGKKSLINSQNSRATGVCEWLNIFSLTLLDMLLSINAGIKLNSFHWNKPLRTIPYQLIKSPSDRSWTGQPVTGVLPLQLFAGDDVFRIVKGCVYAWCIFTFLDQDYCP